MTAFRRDPLGGSWHIVAPERMARPGAVQDAAASSCPFCPGNEDQTPPEIARKTAEPGWSVRVIPNKYPAADQSRRPEPPLPSLLEQAPGIGFHEVIIETPSHGHSIDTLAPSAMEQVVDTWIERIAHHWENDRIKSVTLFKNSGRLSGASIRHPHSQLLALTVPTARAEREAAAATKWTDVRGTCLLCALIEEELRVEDRIVAVSKSFVTLAPFASRFPYQLWVVPRRHQRTPLEASQEQRREIGRLMQSTSRAMRSRGADNSFNWSFLLGPTGADGHWYIEAMPRITGQGGFELSTENYINIVAPEAAASSLRADFTEFQPRERTE